MSGYRGKDRSQRTGIRRNMRDTRERDRQLTLRHRWYAGGIATLLSGALIFTGVAPATAEEVPPADETTTSETTDASTAAEPAPEEKPAAPAPEEKPAAPAPEEKPAETPVDPAPEPKPAPEESKPAPEKSDTKKSESVEPEITDPQSTDTETGDTEPQVKSLLEEGPVIQALIAGPDGADPPYIYWRAVSGGSPLAGATFQVEGPRDNNTGNDNNARWDQNTTTITDCVSATTCPASSLDRDPEVGEFLVKQIGPVGSRHDIRSDRRYRVQQTGTAAGYTIATTGWVKINGTNTALGQVPNPNPWVGNVYNFGDFVSNPIPPATINVNVGGDRTGATSVGPLQGVTLRLYSGGDGGPNNPFTAAWATCVSNASGDCTFTVPDVGTAMTGNQSAQTGGNGGRQFWIVQEDPQPTGWFRNTHIATGSSGATQTQYTVRTPAMTVDGNFDSGTNFMLGTGSSTASASGGIWQESRNNPSFPNRCGIRVALVVDLSGSLRGQLQQVKDAANAMVTALEGTNSSVGVYTFASNAPASAGGNLASTQVATATGANTVRAHINGFTTPTGSTNWDRGIGQVPTGAFDVAIVITDGNPTSYGNAEGPGNYTRFREVENGIFSANRLKAPSAALGGIGTRVVALGVGDGIGGPANNLVAISGPTLGSDYFQSADFTNASNVMRALALGECLGSLTVVKQVVPSTNAPGVTTGAQPAGGWAFTTTTSTANVTVSGSPGSTALPGGAVNFPITFGGGVTNAAVTVSENLAPFPGYAIFPVNNFNATCTATNLAGQTSNVPVTNTTVSGNPGFNLSVPYNQSVSCTVYNKPPLPQSSLVVDKFWRVNGTTVPDAENPFAADGVNASLSINSTAQPWGTPRTGLTAGNTASINETKTPFPADLDLCVHTGVEVRLAGSQTILSTTLPFTTDALAAGANGYTITNVVTCQSELTLVKNVANGGASPTLWDLTAYRSNQQALVGPTGVSGVTGFVTPNVRYDLGEANGPGTYIQTVAPDAVINPPSTGTWICQQVNAQGTVIPGFSDGLNGAVIVFPGNRVRCTATNQTAQLTVLKEVVNDNGGDLEPHEWEITVDPGANGFGLTSTTFDGAENPNGENTFNVRPGHVYTISETGPATYTQVKLQQLVNGNWVDVVGWTVSVPALGAATYRVVNDDIAPTLTLVKSVTNNNGGTASNTAWTLTATSAEGPNLSGLTGVNGPVAANAVYTLGESGGPSGYDWTALSCTGYPNTTKDAPTLTLSPGDDVTCTFTNDDQPGSLTLLKSVDDANGGSAVATDWNQKLTAQRAGDAVLLFDHNVARDVPAGVYTLNEIDQLAGYLWTDLVCSTGSTSMQNKTVTVANGANVVCTFTNASQKPTLTLEKKVVNDGGGSNTADQWTLTARNGDATPINDSGALVGGDPTLAAISGQVVAGLPYTLSESGPSGYSQDGPWACVVTGTQTPVALDDEGRIVVPLAQNVTCRVTNNDTDATGTIAKTSSGPVQAADGTWSLDYTVTVTNNSATASYAYVVNDTFLFGSGITPGTATVISSPASGSTLTPGWNGAAQPQLATGTVPAGAGTTHVYQLRVTGITIADGTEDGTTWQCEIPQPGGFLNRADLFKPGGTTPVGTDYACEEPAFPEVDKEGTNPATQNADASWNVEYTIEISNPGEVDIFAELTDDLPAAPSGWTLVEGTWNVTSTDVSPELDDDLAPGSQVLWDGTLEAGETKLFTVTGVLKPSAEASVIGDCAARGGLLNKATVTSGDIVVDDSGCVTIQTPPVTVSKTDGAAQQLADGTWQIDYTVTVNNGSAYATVYTLTDAPALGTGFSVVDEYWVTGPTPATDTPIAAGGSHPYVYRVIASFDPETEDPQLECVPGQGGAFYNVAEIVFPGGADDDDGCAEPGAPTVTKTGAAPSPGLGGSWSISYTVVVGNTSGMTLAYTLDDVPLALPTGVNLTTPWAVSGPVKAPADAGDATLTAGWNGGDQPQVATGTIPTGATHTYTVTAGVTLTTGVDADDLTCGDEPTENEGIWNTTVVSNGVFEDSGEDCVEILPVPVVVDKADGAVTQLDGGVWEILYTVTVSNPNALPSVYTLTDTPQFDATSYNVVTQGWVGSPDTTDVPIAANATGAAAHVYTYRVTATSKVDPVPASGLTCTDNGGGFFNVATVTYPGGADSDNGCAVPAKPVVNKTALTSVQNAETGEWTIAYQVSVTNPSGIQLWYSVTDTPQALPAGVTGGAWTATGPVPTGTGGVRNVNWNGAGDTLLATGTIQPGATHTYTVSRTVDIDASVTNATLDCPDGGIDNSATVTNGIGGNTVVVCAEIVRPTVDIVKTATGTSQRADGTWDITYSVVVTNDSTTAAAVYDLDDTLLFGGDIEILDASWSGPTGGSAFAGPAWTATLATGQVVAPFADGAGVDTYTVTVHAAVDADAWAGDTLNCLNGQEPSAGGFLNTATVTVNGEPITDDACETPELPEVTKQAQGALQDSEDPESWVVSYLITVQPSGFDTFYTLEDVPGFPAGITLGAGTAQRTDIPGQPVYPLTQPGDAFPDAPVALGADDDAHTWVVTWRATLTDEFDPATERNCGEGPGDGGYYNAVELLQGGEVIDDAEVCIPVTDRVYPTFEKTVTSTSQDPATGLWTIVYSIDVDLAENPEGQNARYSLTDELDFGGDIEVQSATWSGQGTTDEAFDQSGGDWSAIIAVARTIASGATHTYTVTVVADVTAAAIAGETYLCEPGDESPAGGFLNTAVLRSGGIETPWEACSEPVFPEIDKNGGVSTDNGDGTWDIEYFVSVSYPESDADPLPDAVAYDLTDAPALPAGVELDGDWNAEAADDVTPDPSNPTWNGSGTWTIVDDGELTPENDVHTYRVFATVAVTAPPTGELEECDDTESSGIVIWNVGTVTSGEFVADDDGCQTVHFDDVSLVKTAIDLPEGGSVEPGDTFSYELTVTNNGTRAAEDVRVTDDDLNERLEILGLAVAPAEITWGSAPGWTPKSDTQPNDRVDLTIDSLGVGASATITVEVEFLAPDTSGVPPILEEGEQPDVPAPVELLENTACVSTASDGDPDNDCDSAEVPVRDIVASIYTRCVNDAPLLGWTIVKSQSLQGEPIEFVWTPSTGTSTTVPPNVELSQPGGSLTWSDEITWPGTAFTPSGISIDYPGWRAIQASDIVRGSTPTQYYLPGTDVVMTPAQQDEYIFNGLILDPSELDYAWRNDTTVTFTVNPELAFSVDYPESTPTCSVARHTDVQVEKTASVERTEPGKSFTYTLAVENVSDDAAAANVVITDQIPADIKITDVNWAGKGATNVLPNWQSCAVSGQSGSGYGGTLTCELFGPLQPIGSDNGGASTAPTITLKATVNPSSTASVITNIAVVDYHTFGDPDDTGRDSDDATVLLSALPATGGEPATLLMILGLLALLAGATAIVVTRRRRGESTSTR